MKRIFISIFMMAAVVMGAMAQQCWTFHQTSGDSITLDLTQTYGIKPQVKDGNIVWTVKLVDDSGKTTATLDDVSSLEFCSNAQVREQVRKALVEFYEATNGDQWTDNTNWCSDKPIEEWHGVGTWKGYPYVMSLYLGNNNLSGHLPEGDCFMRMVGLRGLHVNDNQIGGSIPQGLKNSILLTNLKMNANQITGELPEWLFDLPLFKFIEVDHNKLTGPIPAGYVKVMDEGFNNNISGNDFSGEVPEAIVNHPRFSQLWDNILPQGGHLTLPTIPAPVLEVGDLNGNRYSTADVYKNNIYTLLYNYSSARSDYTDKLAKAYETYKPKGFEVLGMIPSDETLEEVKGFLKANDINWLNLDPEGFQGFFYRYFLYLNFVNLVDQNGNIVFTSLMDENGKMENTMGKSTRDQLLFDVLEDRFGKVDYTPYTSTDYSRDGEVITLQTATVGNGVDIVFMGDAFVDKDMEPGGRYEQRMREAMEQFFAYEPYTSLRNRFNVYAVKVVSPNAEMYEGTQQAITSDGQAFEYARKIPTLIPNRPLRVNLIYNSYNAGRSITYMYGDQSYLALMFSGVNRVLNHEGGGHGLGRLFDEYVENEGSTASQEVKDYYEQMWTEYGRGANIDIHSDVAQTRWARFAADPRYASEGLGAFEGSGTYSFGIYRPTKNSMMRYGDMPFNAPSREAIYKYVMQESEGPDWEYDYETFVEFDAKGREEFAAGHSIQQTRSKRAAEQGKEWQTLPPVMKQGTWQDAMKNPTKLNH